MNKTLLIKILGLLGAALAAAASCVAGDYVTAGGIIAASLSSATVLSQSTRNASGG